ncbi:hypothetical protein TthTF19_24110 (plasmid) [Thermus thermophilus]|uniref:hypothetical protein n=1 Tax=Thermus thermophilus TaxID=274 RepID=UPI003255385C
MSPRDPLDLGAPWGLPLGVHFFALSQVLAVLRGACPARVLEEARRARKAPRSRTSSQGKGGSLQSQALKAVFARFPGGYRLRFRARLELHFPQAVVRAQLDGLLLGRGETVGLKWAGTASPKRDALEALGFCLQSFAQRNGLRPRLLLVTPQGTFSHALAPVGSFAYRRMGEALERAVEALRQGAPVAGRGCGGCPLRHGCPARAL